MKLIVLIAILLPTTLNAQPYVFADYGRENSFQVGAGLKLTKDLGVEGSYFAKREDVRSGGTVGGPGAGITVMKEKTAAFGFSFVSEVPLSNQFGYAKIGAHKISVTGQSDRAKVTGAVGLRFPFTKNLSGKAEASKIDEWNLSIGLAYQF